MKLDNPYSLSMLFASGGIFGFFAYLSMLGGVCLDHYFSITFIIATLMVIALLFHWGSILEKSQFSISKLPPVFLITLAIIKIYVSFQLIQGGAVDDPDLRLQSFGSSTLITLSGAVSLLFFPIGYFASPTRFVKTIVLSTFIISTIVELIVGASKSAAFGIGFSLLLFIFLRRKQTGLKSNFSLFGIFSALMLSMLLALQLSLGMLLYGMAPSEFMLILINRAVHNFDGAIYGCMIDASNQAPNSFFTYTFLSILKRFDSSFYDLDYFNVPQWLLYEVLGISRDGRFGYPNDNLYVALYFGGLQYFALLLFMVLALSIHTYIKISAAHWRQKKIASPISVVIVFSVPVAFSSIQDFAGLLMVWLLIKGALVAIKAMKRMIQGSNSFGVKSECSN